MNEVRSYATLTGSLLARKGGARPAMRPRSLSDGHTLDDLGWDDMGDSVDGPDVHVPSSIAALTPAPKPAPPREDPPVHVQQRVLADHFAADEAVEASAPEPEPEPVASVELPAPAKPNGVAKADAAGKKAAFTLRLDADRHLRLRLANALTGKSSQQIVTAALDAFLETLPEVGTLARQVPARAAGN